jgi:hypothetical protein
MSDVKEVVAIKQIKSLGLISINISLVQNELAVKTFIKSLP